MDILGVTFTTIGEVIVAYLVINVHSHIAHEKKIDKDVIDTIRRERKTGVLALVLIVLGYLIQILY